MNPGNDINVTGVWKQGNFKNVEPTIHTCIYHGCLGITGKGVKIAILDDGLDFNSKDLKDNFVSKTPSDKLDKREN